MAAAARNKAGQTVPTRLLAAAEALRVGLDGLRFGPPVSHTYNPLTYAWSAYSLYLRTYASGPKRVVFLGMNPGPFGMVQTGVPFGEIDSVRTWLRISAPIAVPPQVHPRRPVLGFDCPRSEVSGRRLWGLFAERFGDAAEFAREHLVLNYCPLAFVESTGRNRTPDKLPAPEREALYALCDRHLAEAIAALSPEWVVGVGDFAAKRAAEALRECGIKIGRILHPSPACPAANRDWKGLAAGQLERLGIWQARPVRPGARAKGAPGRPTPAVPGPTAPGRSK